jgi:DNA modification methylase
LAVNTADLNRTVFVSDNLPFLKSLDDESVDLVVIDPPFGKKQTFRGV